MKLKHQYAAGGNQLRIGIPTNPTLSGNVTITGDLNISQNEIINIGSNFDLYATGVGEYIQYGSNPVIFNGDADVIFRKKGSEEKQQYSLHRELQNYILIIQNDLRQLQQVQKSQET